MNIEEKLKMSIRDVNDFPKEGIVFKDITPIMKDAKLSNDVLDHLVDVYKDEQIDVVAGIESRGFWLPLSYEIGSPFCFNTKERKVAV